MSFPNSVEEIDIGLITEGIDSLNGIELEEYKFRNQLAKEQHLSNERAKADYGYWLDNCGDEAWYCKHCLQPECGKREAKCRLSKGE